MTESSSRIRGRLLPTSVALVSGTFGLLLALPEAGCARDGGVYCPIEEVERVVLISRDSFEVGASESYPELVGATVSIPPDDGESSVSSLMTMTWTVDGVVHSVSWRVESFSW